MAGKVLTMAQQKGGAGKTTLAAQLAVALAARGLKIGLLDIDPQGSLAQWFRIREETGPTDGMTLTAVTGWRAQATVDRLKASSDLVLIDSAPHAEIEAKIAVRVADLILVPIQASPLDLWATEPTLALARAEKRRALLVVNRAQPRARLADALYARIAGLGADIAEATLGNRIAFAASLLAGRGVVETMPRSKAALELQALADEVTKRLPLG